jgi:hypothetical protein
LKPVGKDGKQEPDTADPTVRVNQTNAVTRIQPVRNGISIRCKFMLSSMVLSIRSMPRRGRLYGHSLARIGTGWRELGGAMHPECFTRRAAVGLAVGAAATAQANAMGFAPKEEKAIERVLGIGDFFFRRSHNGIETISASCPSPAITTCQLGGRKRT